MKLSLLLIAFTLTTSAFAEKILPASVDGLRITNVVLDKVSEKISDCGYEYDYEMNNCRSVSTPREVVTVTVEYIVSPVNHIDQLDEVTDSFKQHLEISEFSAEELNALSEKDYQLRLKAAQSILDLQVSHTMKTEYFTPYKATKVNVVKK